MKCLIVLNGECNDYQHLKTMCDESDFIVCADGGLKHLDKIKIKPHIAVGDFDSYPKPCDIECLVYPAEKDLTDFEIAVMYAQNKKFDKIKVTCAMGGRYDHQIANVMLVSKYRGIVIEDESSIICSPCETYKIENFNGRTLSIIPIESSVISLKGFKYNLDKREVFVGDTLTLSNIIESDCAEISLNKGKILVFINK